MEVTAWNNGKHHSSGAGYGLKLTPEDRDRFFKKEWGKVYIELPGYNVEAEVSIDKPSFWNTSCRELISKEIGAWLISSGLAPWQSGLPPKLILEKKDGNHFAVKSKRKLPH